MRRRTTDQFLSQMLAEHGPVDPPATCGKALPCYRHPWRRGLFSIQWPNFRRTLGCVDCLRDSVADALGAETVGHVSPRCDAAAAAAAEPSDPRWRDE